MEVRARAEARTAHPADHLALAQPIAGLHIELTEVAIEAAPPRVGVLHLNGQAIAPGQTTADHQPGKGSHHRGAFRGGQIPACMHQPIAQQGMESPAKAAGGDRRAHQGEEQPAIAIAQQRGRPGGHPKHIGQPKGSPSAR